MSEPKKKPPKVIVPPKPTPSERGPVPSDAEPTACAVCHNPKTGEKCAACGN